MNNRLLMVCGVLAIVATASTPADDISIGAEVDGIQIESSSPQPQQRSSKSQSNASCAVQCNSASSRCSSEVRRARQQCSRGAATGGRDPFDSAATFDSALFCSYFRRPRNCGPGCEARFARHFDMCVNAMDNTASMRHDCFVQERQAENFCRQELRDCEAACK
jgi:hypothetical protein